MKNPLAVELAKMFRQVAKSEFPFADLKFSTKHSDGHATLTVKFDGEVNVLRMWNLIEDWETDYLTITAQGVKRQLV